MCLFRFADELNVLEHSLQRNCFGTFTFSCLTNVPKPALDVTFLTLSCTVFTWRSRSSLFENLWSQSLQVSRVHHFFMDFHMVIKLIFSQKSFSTVWTIPRFFSLFHAFHCAHALCVCSSWPDLLFHRDRCHTCELFSTSPLLYCVFSCDFPGFSFLRHSHHISHMKMCPCHVFCSGAYIGMLPLPHSLQRKTPILVQCLLSTDQSNIKSGWVINISLSGDFGCKMSYILWLTK